MKNIKIYLSILLTYFFIFGAYKPVSAEVISNESPYIEVSDNITLDSKRVGDVYVIAEEINVQNEIDGDFFAVGKKITVNSPINGDARLIAEQITINAPINGSLTYLSTNIYISSLGEIEADAYGFTSKMIHDGRIGRNLSLNNAEDSLSKIAGKVIGNVYYSGAKPETLDGAFINGQIIESFEIQNQESNQRLDLIISKIFHSLTMILVGFIFLKLSPKSLDLFSTEYKSNLGKNILYGIGTFILFPLATILLFVSIIGFPIGISLVAFIIALSYFGFLIPALSLGQKIFDKRPVGMLQIITGVLVLDILTMTPYIGSTLSTIIVVSSIGLVARMLLGKVSLKAKKSKK